MARMLSHTSVRYEWPGPSSSPHSVGPLVCVVTYVPARLPVAPPWPVGQVALTRHSLSSAIPQTSVERPHSRPPATPSTGVAFPAGLQIPIMLLADHL